MLRKKTDFVSYTECRKYVVENNIKTKDEYIKIKHPNNIPTNPNSFYKEEWSDWGTFLRGEKSRKSIIYYSYEECKQIIKKFNITSKSKWFKEINNIITEDNRIPYSPLKTYKDDFIGWGDFLSTGRIQDNMKQYLSFEETKTFVQKLNLKSSDEWKRYCKNKPDNIHSTPNRKYKDEWISFADFLGYEKFDSYGEKIIKGFLLQNNIKFISQKKFEDCKNKNKLPFDFYIEDKNMCIEFDGPQHHRDYNFGGSKSELQNIIKRDNIKTEYCNNNNIFLLRIDYKDKNHICEILQKYL